MNSFFIARGSLLEIQNQMIIFKDLRYINELTYDLFYEKSVESLKLINARNYSAISVFLIYKRII